MEHMCFVICTHPVYITVKFVVSFSANASVNSRDEHCDTCTETDSVLSSRRGMSYLSSLVKLYLSCVMAEHHIRWGTEYISEIIYLFLTKNIHCDPSLEPSR